MFFCISAMTALLLVQQASKPVEQPPKNEQLQGVVQKQIDADVDIQLLKVHSIYIENFGDLPEQRKMQSMLIAALLESKKFVITENKDKADVILKGYATETISQENHSYGEATAVNKSNATISGNSNGQINGNANHISGSSSGHLSGAAASIGAAINDSSSHTETITDSQVSVRLVNKYEDVIWATTQESKGAKYKGASADAADKVIKQLIHDIEKIERKKQSESQNNK